jgi:hypothetical protein
MPAQGTVRVIELSKLTVAEKDDLILTLLPLVGQLAAAQARITDLEARFAAFERPPKTPDNSSLPPSEGQKSDRPVGDKPPRKSLASVVRWRRTPTAPWMPGSITARIAPLPSLPSSRRQTKCMTASSCRPSSRM